MVLFIYFKEEHNSRYFRRKRKGKGYHLSLVLLEAQTFSNACSCLPYCNLRVLSWLILF